MRCHKVFFIAENFRFRVWHWHFYPFFAKNQQFASQNRESSHQISDSVRSRKYLCHSIGTFSPPRILIPSVLQELLHRIAASLLLPQIAKTHDQRFGDKVALIENE